MERVQGPVQGSGRGVRLRWTDPWRCWVQRACVISCFRSWLLFLLSALQKWLIGLFVSRCPSFIPTMHACTSFQSLMGSLYSAAGLGVITAGQGLRSQPVSVWIEYILSGGRDTWLLHVFFLVPLIFRLPCRVFFLFLHNYQVLLFFPPSPSWFLLWNLSW